MNASETLGPMGWAAVGLLVLAAVVAVLFGFTKVFYFAIVLVPVVFVVMFDFCGGRRPGSA